MLSESSTLGRGASRWSPLPPRGVVMWLGIAAGCAIIGFAMTVRPWLSTGIAFGAVLVLVTLARPLVMIGVMLTIGVVDFSFVTGGFKGLLVQSGGLDMNGIRLLAMTAAMFALMLVDRRVLAEALGRHGRIYLLFLAWAAVLLTMTLSAVDGLRFWFKLAYPFLLFVTVLALARRRDIELLADGVLVGGACIVFLINPLLILFGAYGNFEGRLLLPLVGVHPNPHSFYLVTITLMALTRYATRRQSRYLVLCAGALAWLVPMTTRIAFGGGFIALLVLGYLSSRRSGNRRALIASLAATAALAIVLLPAVLRRTFGHVPSPSEMADLMTHPVALYHSLNLEGRQIYWPVVLQAFFAHPVVGLGLGSVRGMLLKVFPPEYGGMVHNEYLRLGAEQGTIGLGLAAFALLGWMRALLRASRVEDRLARELALPAVAAIVALLVFSLTDNTLDYYHQFTQYVAFLGAAGIAAARLTEQTAADVAPAAAEDAAPMEPAT